MIAMCLNPVPSKIPVPFCRLPFKVAILLEVGFGVFLGTFGGSVEDAMLFVGGFLGVFGGPAGFSAAVSGRELVRLRKFVEGGAMVTRKVPKRVHKKQAKKREKNPKFQP